MTTPGPQIRRSAPSTEIVEAFEAQCAREQRSSGAVHEAIMLAYLQMSVKDREQIANVRGQWYANNAAT